MSGAPLLLRCKAESGQHTIRQLTSASTVQDLKHTLNSLTNIPKDSLKVLSGYPPKVLNIENDNQQLSSLSLKSGDVLIVEKHPIAKVKQAESILRQIENQSSLRGILTRQVVPANNSCLFTSINFARKGKLDLSVAGDMRELIAGVVMSDPETYNEAFLEKSNADYCAWIMNDEAWGGAIEVAILSKYYGLEIDVVDTQSARINRFGEDENYSRSILLVYDGIHYDPLTLEPADASTPQTVFSTNDEIILSLALELAAEAKSSRQFTDMNRFALRCLICQKALAGQSAAQEHAKLTGHINFGEY
jgi:ubiquitin thioesterase OTU1